MDFDHKFRSPSKKKKTKKMSAIDKDDQDLLGNYAIQSMMGSASEKEAHEERIQSLFGDNSRQLQEMEQLSITELARYTSKDKLPAEVEKQLLEGLNSEGWGVSNASEAFERIDQDGVVVKEITVNATGECFTHIEFYMGDTEVGYIYSKGTLCRVAVVSDQDIYPEEPITSEPSSQMDTADRVHLNRKRG
jgi:hypothetical protein